jgi:hypothetical protein
LRITLVTLAKGHSAPIIDPAQTRYRFRRAKRRGTGALDQLRRKTSVTVIDLNVLIEMSPDTTVLLRRSDRSV